MLAGRRILALKPQYSRALSSIRRYGLAIVIAAAATVLQWAIIPRLGTITPYDVAVLGAVAATVLLGIGPGLLSLLMAYFAVEVFILGSGPRLLQEETLLRLGASLAIGTGICSILHSVRIAYLKSKRSEERLTTFAAATFEGIVESEAGRILDCNEQFAQMAGFTTAELKGMAIADLIAPEDRERVTANITGNLESVVEHAALRKNGTRIIVEAHGQPTARDANRRYTIVRDITDRKHAEAALESHRRMLETVVSHVPAAVCLIRGSDLRLQLVNQAYHAIAPGKEMLGKTLDELWPETGQDFSSICRRVLETGEVYHVDDELNMIRRRPDTAPEPAYFSWSMHRVLLPGDNGWGILNTAWETTDRKLGEEKLRESEARLRLAQVSAGAGVWDWDLSTGKLTWSEELFRLFGLEAGKTEASFDSWRSAIHPDDRLNAETRIETAIKNRTPLSSTYRIVLPSGDVRWIDALGSTIYDSDGRPRRMSGICLDVTESKRTAAELGLISKKYSTMFDTTSDGVWVHDLDGRIQEVNDAYCRMSGYSREELTGMEISRLEVRESRDQIASHIREVFDGTGHDRFESRHRRKDGSIFDVDITALRMDIEGGRIAIFVRDNTDRKRAEEALRQGEARRKVAEAVEVERQRLFDVLETLPAMICLISPDYHITFANRSFRERFGESGGRPCFESCFGRDKPCEFCETFNVLKTGHPHHWEVNISDGTAIDVYDFPFTDVDGSPLILEMDLDITERRRAERELRQANEDLATRAAQLRALAGELTLTEQRERRRMAKMLHDHLQQLLVGAKFRVTILGRAGDDVVREGAREVESLLDECITASRSLTAELSPPILHDAGLNAGLEWLARWMADKHGLFVELSMEDLSAPMADDVKLLLFESVKELLFNVVKHSHSRSAAVNMRYVDGQIQIVVSDQGVGFDPKATPPAGKKGGGFGLFSIRERLDFIGGRIEIQSAPGRGSRFVLLAPAAKSPALNSELQSVEMPADRTEVRILSPQPRIKLRLLLADDHAVVREALGLLLAQEPDIQIVGEAADGQEAVEMASQLQPDIILMDISMPRLNGIEATRAIRRDYPDIRIIGLSMFEEPERSQALREAGAVAFVTKSGISSDLIAAIRAAGAGRL